MIEQLRDVFVSRGYDGATLTHLASAAGLSKASLYHHFPGGKPEMAGTLVRHAIADLQRQAFSRLNGSAATADKLLGFIDGFSAYTQAGESDCLLAVFNHHNTATEHTSSHQQAIAAQFDDWHGSMTRVFEQSGMKPRRANREAHDLMGALYGALLIAKMHNQPDLFTDAIKRIRKRIQKQLS